MILIIAATTSGVHRGIRWISELNLWSAAAMMVYILVTGQTAFLLNPLSMALCVAVLASEFLQVSLLTPIAAELDFTEGQIGQAISISGVFAVLACLSSPD